MNVPAIRQERSLSVLEDKIDTSINLAFQDGFITTTPIIGADSSSGYQQYLNHSNLRDVIDEPINTFLCHFINVTRDPRVDLVPTKTTQKYGASQDAQRRGKIHTILNSGNKNRNEMTEQQIIAMDPATERLIRTLLIVLIKEIAYPLIFGPSKQEEDYFTANKPHNVVEPPKFSRGQGKMLADLVKKQAELNKLPTSDSIIAIPSESVRDVNANINISHMVPQIKE